MEVSQSLAAKSGNHGRPIEDGTACWWPFRETAHHELSGRQSA